ncbi:hypothetical protein M426DRAFT_15720 [Hypoxylon sp. CI-4A]|nr:hypothetical protein M426DRAFT_15720 [Hypoxylon sp. CI-4A]
MSSLVSKPSCPCTKEPKRNGNPPRQIEVGLKPTPSGKCPSCLTAAHREGQVMNPKGLEHLTEKPKPWSYARGYYDDNKSCRLSIIQMVAKLTDGLTHDQEVDLAARVYTQLKMESNPLVDPKWERRAEYLSRRVWVALHVVLNEQIGAFYRFYVPEGGQVIYFI